MGVKKKKKIVVRTVIKNMDIAELPTQQSEAPLSPFLFIWIKVI